MAYDRLASITLHQLRIFAAVAERRSFARAAEHLDLSPATVSDQVKLLEAVVGMRLLERSRGRRSVELTEAGRLLLDTHDAFSRALERASAGMELLRQSYSGTVAFGADLTFGGYVLPRLLDAFRAAHPGVQVHIEVDRRQNLLRDLVRRRLDLAVLVGPVDGPGLESDPLAGCFVVLVGPAGHRLAGAGSASFGELARETLVLPDRGSILRQRLEQMAAERQSMLGPVLEVSDVDTRKQTIISGLGIGPLTSYEAAAAIAAGHLALLNVEGFPLRLDWLVGYLRGPFRPEVQTFKDYLLLQRAALEDLAPPLRKPDARAPWRPAGAWG